MSTPEPAQEWDFTVPADASELAAELRRHGVRPGQRVHLRVVDTASGPAGQDFYGALAGFPEPSWEDFEHASVTARQDFSLT